MHRDFGEAMPILHNNFWLVVHVTTIMAGYAAAALALVLANIALAYYLFGRYEGRPPDVRLARGIYRHGDSGRHAGRRNAVGRALGRQRLGTLLGLGFERGVGFGFTAGLFGRVARATGRLDRRFGLSLAAVLGATVILLNWYGVNFLLGMACIPTALAPVGFGRSVRP